MQLLAEARGLESHYNEGTIEISEGLEFSQREMLQKVDYYSNSKYLSGNRDELGREKPFYNIVNFRVQIAQVATDLDIKDIRITADHPKFWVRGMLLQREAYEWMKEVNFSYTMNQIGESRARNGGVLVKKVKENGTINFKRVKWANVCTDQVDILDNPILEKHFMTVGDLYKKSDIWENVDEVLEHAENEKGESLLHTDRIEIWEFRGNMPLSWLKEAQGLESEEEDDWVYVDMVAYMYPLLEDEPILYAAKEDNLYRYLPWTELDGRGLGRGVVEESEEAQVWTNDAVINEKIAMDLGGRVGVKTNSDNIEGNILEHDHGKIYKLTGDSDMQPITFAPASLGQFGQLVEKWDVQVSKATSTFDANTGEQPPSGTPYSQTALLNQVASRPFDYQREKAGIWYTELFNEDVIPELVKRIKKKHILTSEFTDEELAVIDHDFAVHEANKRVLDAILEGKVTSEEEYFEMVESYKFNLKKQGSERSLEVPDGYFDGVGVKVTVQVTNEQRDKRVALESLSTILNTVAGSFNPETGKFAILEDETLSRLFGEIVELAGTNISPAQLVQRSRSSKQQPAPIPRTQAPIIQEEEVTQV